MIELKFFSLDTSSERLVMGYIDEETGTSADFNVALKARHSEVLIHLIDSFLRSLNVNLKDVDLFGCGLGPGFFTALRVGIATVKSFALALERKVVGIPSSDPIAMNLPLDGRIMVLLYARKNHFYLSMYEKEKEELKIVLPHSFYDIENLLKKLEEFSKLGEIFVSGNGIPYIIDELEGYNNFIVLDENSWYISGMKLTELVVKRYKKNENIYDAFNLLPLYIQKPFVVLKEKGGGKI